MGSECGDGGGGSGGGGGGGVGFGVAVVVGGMWVGEGLRGGAAGYCRRSSLLDAQPATSDVAGRQLLAPSPSSGACATLCGRVADGLASDSRSAGPRFFTTVKMRWQRRLVRAYLPKVMHAMIAAKEQRIFDLQPATASFTVVLGVPSQRRQSAAVHEPCANKEA